MTEFRSALCGLTRKNERNSTSGALFQTETETYLIVFYPRTLSRIIQGQFCNQRSVFKHCTGSFNKLYNSTFICLEGNINKNLLKWLNLQLLLVISREKLPAKIRAILIGNGNIEQDRQRSVFKHCTDPFNKFHNLSI